MNSIIDPKVIYEPFNGMPLDQLRENVEEILMNGVTLKCDNDTNVVLRADTLAKRGSFKDIYLLNILSIADKVYDSRGYIMKVRFTNNTPEYWNNEQAIIPNQGVIPMIMSEGKRYSMIDGELKKYFATVLPTKSNILLITREYIVDFIIQEKMTLSLDFIRKHYQLPVDVIHYIMHNLIEIAVAMNNKGYTFTNFSPTAVMMNFNDNKVDFKLVNTSFIQRGDMIPVNGRMKLYSTASIKQLTDQSDDPMKTMIINILYTCFDIYSPLSLAQKINKTCCNNSGDYDCVVKHLIDSRNKQVEYYSTTDNVFGDLIQIIKDNGNNTSVIIDKLMNATSVDDSVVSKFVNIIYDAISSTVTFEQSTLDYTNSDAYVPTCDMNDSDNTNNSTLFSSRVSKGNDMSTKPSTIRSSYTVGNLFDEDSESVSSKPIFSTSSFKPTVKSTRNTSLFNNSVSSNLPASVRSTRGTSLIDEDDEDTDNIFNYSSSLFDKSSTVQPSYTVGNLFDDNNSDDLFSSYTTKSSTFASSRPKPTRKSLFSSMPVASNETIPETITKQSVSLKPTSVKSSYTVGNLFDENNTDGTDEDETVSLKSIFSTSLPASKPTSTASLFEEDKSMSLKPIFSTSLPASKPASVYSSISSNLPASKPASVYSSISSNLPASKPASVYSSMSSNLPASKPISVMYNSTSVSDKCEYLNNRIDELQNEMNRKFDEIISRLDN